MLPYSCSCTATHCCKYRGDRDLIKRPSEERAQRYEYHHAERAGVSQSSMDCGPDASICYPDPSPGCFVLAEPVIVLIRNCYLACRTGMGARTINRAPLRALLELCITHLVGSCVWRKAHAIARRRRDGACLCRRLDGRRCCVENTPILSGSLGGKISLVPCTWYEIS